MHAINPEESLFRIAATVAFKTKFNGLIWNASEVYTTTKYEQAMELIKKEHAAIHEYLVESAPVLWARAKFPLPLFNTVGRVAERLAW
ncbi:hypothetical protein PsorP6_001500 [Peronosclerospora sorghi]|uniref:Uncharacterized protein n=1 Tax=Peronosclerospora sorghi TaxID=230839 RepID=A0ACC0WQM9_9STRA|nr:hypothetical protein PsorP6_001500 [Peronosclerospora sorghi]